MPQEQTSWLVGPEGQASLSVLMDRFRQDPETEIQRTIGPENAPELIVVAMSAETAQRYQKEFQGQFLFEFNAPLNPLDSGAGSN